MGMQPYMEPYYEYGYSSAVDSVAMGIGGFFLVFILLWKRYYM